MRDSIEFPAIAAGRRGSWRTRRPRGFRAGKRVAGILAVAALLVSTTGCLVTASNKSYETGTRVPAGTLGQVTPGETTTAWVIATLGEPTRRDQVDDGEGEILVYHHSETQTKRGSVFLVFKDTSRRKRTRSVYFETRNDIVQRYWIED